MIELSSDPFVLKPRNTPLTEADFRLHLNISWCRGVLFNVVAMKNSIAVVEYDAILWSDDSIMFVEYKDSVSAYRDLSSRRVQQMKGFAKNIARGLGYRCYEFIVAVKGLEQRSSKGGADVLPLFELGSHEPRFVSSIMELEYINKLIAKYSRAGRQRPSELSESGDQANPPDLAVQAEFVRELEKLKKIFEVEQP